MSNLLFQKNGEVPIPVTYTVDGKKVSNLVGVQMIADGVFEGQVVRKNTVIGTYEWNRHKFEKPIFRPTATDDRKFPKRVVKAPINDAIADAVNRYRC